MSDLLRTYERGVLRVTLNRPESRNALTRSMLRELRLVFEAYAVGLVNRVTGADSDFMEDVERFVAPMFEHQPHVLRAIKALALANRRGASVAELREYEIASFLETSTHESHRALLGKLQAERG
jgi:enoyl-CoA hydratase/carnithine racemase